MADVVLTATPLRGLIGGMMIGLASALMLLALGRIAGISGLAARASRIAADGVPWSWAMVFAVGLPLGAALIATALGPVQTHFPRSPDILIIGGLVVGFGTRPQRMHQLPRGVRGIPKLPSIDCGDSDLYSRRHRHRRGHASPGRGGMIRSVLTALWSGTLFGAGLAVSGMAERVRGFLDAFGHWDPTLAFVMGGAVAVMAAA